MHLAVLLSAVFLLVIGFPCGEAKTGVPYSVPADFMWGTATAAYQVLCLQCVVVRAVMCTQVEGAWQTDGRGLSIWDVFSHTPNKTHNGDTGDVADDHYNRVAEDIALMKAMGVTYVLSPVNLAIFHLLFD